MYSFRESLIRNVVFCKPMITDDQLYETSSFSLEAEGTEAFV